MKQILTLTLIAGIMSLSSSASLADVIDSCKTQSWIIMLNNPASAGTKDQTFKALTLASSFPESLEVVSVLSLGGDSPLSQLMVGVDGVEKPTMTSINGVLRPTRSNQELEIERKKALKQIATIGGNVDVYCNEEVSPNPRLSGSN